jgi:hypothetical protein
VEAQFQVLYVKDGSSLLEPTLTSVFTIYLDHNIAHFFVRGFRTAEAETVERMALTDAIGRYPDLRFVLSAWNLTEAASERKPNQPPEALARRYADFFEQLKPLHIPAHNVIEREEFNRLVYRTLGLIDPSEVPVFSEHLSQVLALSGIQGGIVGFDLRAYLLYLCRDPKRRAGTNQAKEVALQKRRILLKAIEDGRYNATVQSQILREWLQSYLPERKPDGALLPLPIRQHALEQLLKNRDLVYSACPAMFAEDALTGVRSNQGSRKPQLNDGVDLMHAIVPLAYCDAVLSDDGNFRAGAERVLKITGRRVAIARSLSDALRQLDTFR